MEHFQPAYLLALLIGLLLGMAGSGGSILTVPILVYAFHIEPFIATTYSLFIVGLTAMVGAVRSTINKSNDLKAAVAFAPFSIFSVLLVIEWVHRIPLQIQFSNISFSRNVLIMVCFAALMLAASYTMIKKEKPPKASSSNRWYIVPLLGLFVGAVTGFVGAGGGFLIVPALVLFANVPMKKAVGTSLVIITVNSFVGFFSKQKNLPGINWNLLFIFSALAIIGIMIGLTLQKRVPGGKLRKGFGYFIIIMAAYIIIKELVL